MHGRSAASLVLLALASGCTADDEARIAAPPTARVLSPAAAMTGEWTGILSWPVTPVHAQLMPDGRLLAWGSENPWDSTYQNAAIWDPTDNSFMMVPSTLVNVFCSGHTFLPDGRLLVTGGHLPGGAGKNDITIFDPASGTWIPSGHMYEGRWYPTNVTLGNGDVAILAGLTKAKVNNPIPEVWSNGTLRKLTKASRSIFFYPWLYLAPDGRVFHAGPEKSAQFLNTAGTGAWTLGPSSTQALRNQGSSVMFDLGKILVLGGGGTPSKTAERISLMGASPRWTRTADMTYARRQVTATVLADGTVLVVGGSSTAAFNDPAGAVRTPELWDPATNTWTVLAPHAENRLYHSVAVLLPDARVLVGGGTDGLSGEPLANHQNVEIFSPPYLFQSDGSLAPRPSITTAPGSATWGQTITVETPDSAAVQRVTITRLATITHTFSQDNRFMRLTFGGAPGGLGVQIPTSRNQLPPGWYMIFLVDSAGRPSVAKVILIS